MPRPDQCIEVDDARKLQDQWVGTRAQEIRNARGFQDTREFWFSLDVLQEFIDYIKEESPAGSKPGVRIYFGSYKPGEGPDYGKGEGGKKGYSTVFLAPTLEEASAADSTQTTQINNYDIDPLNNGEGGVPPTTY
ncbi:hypothetical protein [Salegentibacter chungangensis]|uniref:Uncharacterized protein n=1 Tax=Salegentibacter chungangensis TaxID=1335724 RepID=A0ABW3NWI5_9FLAO